MICVSFERVLLERRLIDGRHDYDEDNDLKQVIGLAWPLYGYLSLGIRFGAFAYPRA